MPETPPEVVAAVTRAIRAADLAFESSGGSSRHWLRDQLLPRLEEEGLRIVWTDSLKTLAEYVVHHVGVESWPGHPTAWHCDLCDNDERDGGHKSECLLFGEAHS